MKTFKWLILSLTLILSATLVAPAAASPAHTSCAGELSNLTITGDVIVPAGEDCQLINAIVLGNVQVKQRSTVEVYASHVEGALTGADFELVRLGDAAVGEHIRLTGGASVRLEGVTVEGDTHLIGQVDARVQQSRVTGTLVVRDSGEVALFCGTTVEGDARFADNRGGLLVGGDQADCTGNEVQGNLRVHHNQSDTTIVNNVVGQNLVCAANDPAPVVYGNQVSGIARGQCGAGEPVDATEIGRDE